jgi:hypothetical protein
MSTKKERIQKFWEGKGCTTAKAFVGKLGISASHISEIDTRKDNSKLQAAIYSNPEFSDLNWHWLQTGEGDMFATVPVPIAPLPSDQSASAKEPIRQAIDEELDTMDKSQLIDVLKYCAGVALENINDEQSSAGRRRVFFRGGRKARGLPNAAALAKENKKRMEKYAENQKLKA